jgi:hypothetical protein
MRSHGVPNFPDPTSQGDLNITGIDPNSTQFRVAQATCQRLGAGVAPSHAQQTLQHEQLLQFAACMRAHGEPSFPDPSSSGVFPIGRASGNPDSVQYRSAQDACNHDLPGNRRGG